MQFKDVEFKMNQELNVDIVESITHPGFYIYPEDKRFVVSIGGEIRYADSHKEVCLSVGFWGYIVINDVGTPIHRAIGVTFLKCPGDPEEMVINHFDGDKYNNALSNLHWATRSENSIHAYVTGLRPDNKRILVKNLETDEVVELYSLNELARQFGVNPSTVSIYMNSKRNAPFMEKYTMIFSGESHWPNLTKDDIGKHRNGLPKTVFLKTTEGKKYIFSSVGHVAEYLNLNSGILYAYLNKAIKDLKKHKIEELRYVYDSIMSEDIIVVPKPSRTKYVPRRKPVPIRVTDLITKEVFMYDSSEEFAMLKGVKKNTLQKNVHENGRWRHFKIEYLKQ